MAGEDKSEAKRLTLHLKDSEATEKLGEVLGDAIQDGAVILLSGALGSGKTTLVKGLARALGVKEIVNSPTFTMMNEYHSGRLPLYHLDFYRLSEDQSAAEALLEIELAELITEPVVVAMEWAELFGRNEERYKDRADGGPGKGVQKQESDNAYEGADRGSESFIRRLDSILLSIKYNNGGKEDEVKASKAEPEKISPGPNGESRTAFLTSSGPRSAALIKGLEADLDAMFIYS